MLIVLNNKSSFNVENFSKYLLELDEIKKKDNLILCPSSCYLPFCIDKNITIGSQDVSMKNTLSQQENIHPYQTNYGFYGLSFRR